MQYDDEQIKKMIANGEPYEVIGRIFGVSGASIKKRAKKIGVPLKPRRKKNEKETFNKGVSLNGVKYCKNCGKEIPKSSANIYCSSECFQEHIFNERVKDWKENPNKYRKEEIPSFIRRYILNKAGCKCEKCGWSEINEYTGTVPLEIHHIDGDCTNNNEENLQVLCPNHHSLTKNFGSLNNGKSKRYKLKEYKDKLKNGDCTG